MNKALVGGWCDQFTLGYMVLHGTTTTLLTDLVNAFL
jgi:hypothetical protein